MQTIIHPALQSRSDVLEAEAILKKCVHCGFCTATCPTYQLLGDELDGPRGRIYLIKSLIEENTISEPSIEHLNRCLTCRACETTCPSGVAYGRLLDIGRGLIEESITQEPWFTGSFKNSFKSNRRRLLSWILRQLIPRAGLFSPLLKMGQLFRPLLPGLIAEHIPRPAPRLVYPVEAMPKPAMNIILLQGCVQKSATPNVNAAIEYLLSENQVQTEYLSEEGCCGALDYHLAAHDAGIARMKTMVDRLHARLDKVDYIVSSASGCGVTIKEYPELLAANPDYAKKASEVCAKLVDISELLAQFEYHCEGLSVAVHVPCSLQHGQKLPSIIETILEKSGAVVLPIKDKHLCCGSAGTYSILEPGLSQTLAANKIEALTASNPDVIVTANVGCQTHLDGALAREQGADKRVIHWVEFLANQHAAQTGQ